MITVDENRIEADLGNTLSFEELYQQHNRLVYCLCLRMTRNNSEAEDLAQEVFSQVLLKLKSFRGESSITTWLYSFTVNQVLMHFRKPRVKMERMIGNI